MAENERRTMIRRVEDFITRAEHDDLKARMTEVERTLRDMKTKLDKLDGMATMLRFIVGASLIGAVASLLTIIELVQHASTTP